MKNKIFPIIICVIFTFILIGCDKSEKREKENHSDKINSTKTMFSDFRKLNINCEPIKDIVDFSSFDSMFITNDGKLYSISFDKFFSNNTNCKQFDSEKTFLRFLRGGILDSDNNIYLFNNYSENKSFLELFIPKDGYPTAPNGVAKVVSKSNLKYTIFSDVDHIYGSNQIYSFLYDENFKMIYPYRDSTQKVDNTPLFKLNADEEMQYLTYGGIKTNKAYYSYGRVSDNKTECEKYADIKCNYINGFYKVELYDLNKHFDNIKYILVYSVHDELRYFMVDNNNNIYTNLMGG